MCSLKSNKQISQSKSKRKEKKKRNILCIEIRITFQMFRLKESDPPHPRNRTVSIQTCQKLSIGPFSLFQRNPIEFFFVLRNWNLFDLKKWELHCVNAQRRPSNAMKVQSLLPPSRWNVPWQSKAKEYYGHTSVRNSIFHSVRDNQQSSVKNQSFSDGICYAGIWFDSSKHFERAAAIIFPFECGIWGNESFAIRKSQKSIHFHEYFDMMCVTGAVNLKIIYAILICI